MNINFILLLILFIFIFFIFKRFNILEENINYSDHKKLGKANTAPILIGGATTSKGHTALKIEPAYKTGQTIHVADASRSVGVLQNLVSDMISSEMH